MNTTQRQIILEREGFEQARADFQRRIDAASVAYRPAGASLAQRIAPGIIGGIHGAQQDFLTWLNTVQADTPFPRALRGRAELCSLDAPSWAVIGLHAILSSDEIYTGAKTTQLAFAIAQRARQEIAFQEWSATPEGAEAVEFISRTKGIVGLSDSSRIKLEMTKRQIRASWKRANSLKVGADIVATICAHSEGWLMQFLKENRNRQYSCVKLTEAGRAELEADRARGPTLPQLLPMIIEPTEWTCSNHTELSASPS